MRRVILFLLFWTVASAQTPIQPPLVTDRPDHTESSITVPSGLVQIETGIAFEKFKFGQYNIDLFKSGISSTLIRVGLTRRIELRLLGEVAFELGETPCNSDDFTGFIGTGLGTKIFIAEEKKWLPETAVILHVDLPMGDLDACYTEFVSRKAEPSILLAMSKSISNRVGVGWNLGVADLENDDTEWIYSAAIGVELTEKIGTFVEIYGAAIHGQDPTLYFDAGFTVGFRPNLQWDLSFGWPLTGHATDFFLSTGLTLRLPR